MAKLTKNNTSKVNKQSKGKKYKTQIEIFNKYLSTRIATAKMVSTSTGLPIEACCRFKSKLQKKGLLQQPDKRITFQTNAG